MNTLSPRLSACTPLRLAVVIALAAAGPATAQTWSNTGAGTFSWNTTASWGGSPFPNAVDAAANMGVDIVGDQTINLGQAITVGSLTYGDTNSTNTMTIASGNSLTFSASAGNASFTTSANTNANAINAAVTIASPLTATHAGTGLMTFGGIIGGSGSLTKAGTGTIVLSGANTFNGGTVINTGVLRGTVAGAFGGNTTASAITLAGGTLELFSSTATTFTNSAVTVTANSTVITNRAAAGAGITHTVGALTIGANTLTVTPVVATSGTQGLTVGAVTLTGNATLNVTTIASVTSLLTVGAVGGGNFSLTKAGAGNMTLTAAGTYSGGTLIQGGVVQVNNNTSLGSGDVTLTTTAAGRLLINAGVTIANNVTINTSVGSTGLGMIQQTGTGQARVNGIVTINGNPSAGGHFVAGTAAGNELVLGGAINSANPNQGFTHRAGRVVYAGGGNITGVMSVTDTAFVGATNGIPVGLSVLLGGSASATLDLGTLGFDQAVAGLTLGTATSANVGTINVGGRTLTLNGDVASVSGATQLASHAFNATAGGTIVVGPTGRTFTVADSLAPNDLTINGAAVTGAGGITKAGAGTLALRGVTMDGPLTVNAGTVAPSTASGVGGTLTVPALSFTAPATVRLGVGATGDVINGGTVTTAGTVTFALTASGGTLANGTYPLITYTGTSPGLANFAIGSFGRATATLVDTGTAIAANVTGFDRVVWTGATDANWNGTSTNWQTQTGGSATTFQTGDDVIFPDAPPGPGGSTITVTAPVAPGSVSVTATTTNYTIISAAPNQIGGTGGLTKSGGATLTLTGANAYSGPTTITGGTVVINGTNSIGDGTAANTLALSGGGTLSMAATTDLGVSRSIAAGGGGGSLLYTGAAAATITVGGNITGTGPLSFLSSSTGAATVATYSLSGSNSGYTGAITVNSSSTGLASLLVNGQSAAPGGGSITVSFPAAAAANGNANTLRLVGVALPAAVTLNLTSNLNGALSLRSQVTSGGTSSINGPITVAGNSIVQITPDAGATMTINGNVTEATPGGFTGTMFVRGAGTGVVNGSINLPGGIVAKTDGGVWTFNSSAGNNWTTTQVLSSGSVRLGASNAFPAGALLQIGQSSDAANTLLEMNGFNLTVNGLTWVSGNANSNRAVGNSSATLSTLTISSATNQTYGSTIATVTPPSFTGGLLTGNLKLIKSGSSTQTLGGANTYSGGTVINNGTLTLTNTTGSGTGTGPVTVAGGGTLNGTGILGPSSGNGVTVQPGGTLKAGMSPGVLTIAPAAGGAVTFSTGSTFAVDVQGTTPGNTATNYGQLVVTGGSIDLGGSTLAANFSVYTPSQTDAINIINYAGATLTGTFNGLPDGALAYSNVLGSGVDYHIFYGTIVPNQVTLTPTPVPEPGSILLAAGGGLALAALRRRRSRAVQRTAG